MLINEGFVPRKKKNDRLPPGQYEARDFPVLSLGPTPHIDSKEWRLKIFGLAKKTTLTLEELKALNTEAVTKDIHCVTKWSKFDTHWTGVPLAKILELAEVGEDATHVIAHSADGYTTNLTLDEIRDRAWIVFEYEGELIEAEHGGPVRMLVPHLYFWKSAKWLTGLEFVDGDEPGFWEVRGYHNHGDPWTEERYS